MSATTNSDTPTPPEPYHVVYSGRVLAELERLLQQAAERGLGEPILAAMEEIERRLSLYPQFGQPIRDLQRKPSQIWIGVIHPLVVQYSIHEDIRQVWVTVPILVLSGFFPPAK